MRFQILKQEDQTLALEVPDNLIMLEVPDALLQRLTSPSSSGAEAPLKESQVKVVELEEKLANAESRTMDDFTPTEKANFVIQWAKELSLEDKAIFCETVGIPMAKATEAEVAEVEAKQKAEDEEPKTIQGKTDRPGYRFLEYLDLSVKEDWK